MKKNYTKYVIAMVVVFAAMGYVIVSAATSKNSIYYKEVSELVSNPEVVRGKGLRVSGGVTYENFSLDKFNQIATFELTDDKGGIMNVVYKGTVPDAFEKGADVVLEGVYDPDTNQFSASKLMAKCPSKYEAEDEDSHPEGVPMQS